MILNEPKLAVPDLESSNNQLQQKLVSLSLIVALMTSQFPPRISLIFFFFFNFQKVGKRMKRTQQRVAGYVMERMMMMMMMTIIIT